MTGRLEIACVEYHTAGEPFRILSGGFGRVPGADMLAKRRHAREHLDHYRRLVVNEPRGHADMYGCFVTDPVDERSAFGAVFFHNAGYSTACGHGTIALGAWAAATGRLDGSELLIDVPSGPVTARVGDTIAFGNVPSWVALRGLRIATGRGLVDVDVAYGGAFYASVEAAALGIAVEPGNVADFIALGREIKAAVEAEVELVHPQLTDIRDVYGVTFFEPVAERTQRNVTVFADGEVDRSPCGSGTSARLALLEADGVVGPGRPLRHLSIIGTEFVGHITGQAPEGVLTEIEGTAHPVARHEFFLDPGDPLGTGFLLR
jgi:proline racemase